MRARASGCIGSLLRVVSQLCQGGVLAHTGVRTGAPEEHMGLTCPGTAPAAGAKAEDDSSRSRPGLGLLRRCLVVAESSLRLLLVKAHSL